MVYLFVIIFQIDECLEMASHLTLIPFNFP